MLNFQSVIVLLLSVLMTMPSYAQEDDAGAALESEDPVYSDAQLPADPGPDTPIKTKPPPPTTPPSKKEFKASDHQQGEKVFDWSKYENATEVPHPFAEKGLMRITKDRTYIYKVDQTEQKRAFAFRIGIFNPANLENPDQAGQRGAGFEENYDQASNPAILFDYEWQLWQSAIGKIGLRAGTGAFIAQGNGHFVSEVNAGRTPEEVFTFWAMPNAAGAVYRMQLWDNQFLVPYAEGGALGIAFGEFRDDDRPPKWGGALAAYYAGGLAFNLTWFDAMSAINLDREYGINRVYLTVEYRGIVAITQTYDFTSDLINGGLLMEF